MSEGIGPPPGPPPPPPPPLVTTEEEEELEEEYVMVDLLLPSGLSVAAAITCDEAEDFSLTEVRPSSVVYALDLAAIASWTDAPSGTSRERGASIVCQKKLNYWCFFLSLRGIICFAPGFPAQSMRT